MEEEAKSSDSNKQGADGVEKVAMASPINHISSFSKRKLSGQDKPRKILRTGTHMIYEQESDEGENVEQNFTDAFALIAAENTEDTSGTVTQHYYMENQVLKPVHPDTLPTNHVYTESSLNVDNNERHETEQTTQKHNSFHNPEINGSSEQSLGPKALGLVPVYKAAPQIKVAVTAPQVTQKQHNKLEERISILEQQLLSLQHKHELLQQSHEKLTELVEAQNHLLACHTAPPPTKEALSTFPPDESEFDQSPEEPVTPVTPSVPPSTTESGIFTRVIPMPNEHYPLPRKVTAKDIIRLWEDGTKSIPPVKNWSPAQKMRIQSKLSRWKKIIDIFKGECQSDLDDFEQKYSGENGEMLPVTTILALHENQLSSDFLSKGFSNLKQVSIDLSKTSNVKTENDVDNADMMSEDSATHDEMVTIPEPMVTEEKTNRYVLPRKVSAREVVYLWENGCSEFPAVVTWTKAQKIGQETKIFRWKKIVDIFKKDCESDWHVFTQRYSNDKGELLPLATILAKHDALNAEEQLELSRQNAELAKESGNETDSASNITSTPVGEKRTYRVPRDPDSIPLPRKVTAFEVIRYWTEGSETFGPVKDWTRAQKMGQETKISRWKKIYEIFRYQCHRDWDEFCGRYTNARGELLPLATILAKYEAENPSAPSNYPTHSLLSPTSTTPDTGDGDKYLVVIPEPADIDIVANDNGEYMLPKKMSAVEALSLWEHGTEQVPPLKLWSEEQVVEKDQFNDIKQIAAIYENECGGIYRRFVERFSDTDGEMLPIAGIIYSSDCRKYSPFFTVYGKSIKHSRSRGEPYVLPKRCGAKEIVWLWEKGCQDFPPVKTWSSAQKLRFTTKLSRWKKIVEIFHQKCESNWRIYEEKYSNAAGELLAISTVISMQDEGDNDSYASMIKKSSDTSMLPTTPQSSSTSNSNIDVHDEQRNEMTRSSATGDPDEYYLPRRVNALDIINFWERGFGNMPPVAQWSPLQKFRQRSKISRWSKVYDIYKNHCNSDLNEFEKLYTDKEGQLFPPTTIIAMHESRHDNENNMSFDMTDEYDTNTKPAVRKYLLPRRVDAKDIVKLWMNGCDDFPPIVSWSKADKIGQETKIFRWKKIVDIFLNHCDSNWETFESLFANEYGELLPTSAIIAKYETALTKD